MKPLLLLSTRQKFHAKRSGYRVLADYVPGAEYLETVRADPVRPLPLFFARVARRCAFSRWYLGGSAALEWQALQRIRSGFEGIVHTMWADHDHGFLDLFLDRNRHKLCGTFHNCDDDFRHTIRFPSRLRRFDAIILMSDSQRDFFLKAGVPDRKLHVVLHGVDTEYFTPPARREVEEFTVLSVGGFRRNFPLLRDVCMQSKVRFEIVAPESFRPMFSEIPNVKFSSGLSDEELLERYRSASCLIHTAENATANNALLEAMACGLPIISERVGGIPEYAESQILAASGDGAALVRAINHLAESPSAREELSCAARRRAEELSWHNVAARMTEIYASL